MSIPIGDPRPAGEEGPAGDQRPAGEEGEAGDPRPAGEAASKNGGKRDEPFDPADHTVDEVNDHLANASPGERGRVIAAEKAGKNRSSIIG